MRCSSIIPRVWKKIGALFSLLFGLALIAGLGYGMYAITSAVWTELTEANPQLVLGVIAAATTLLGSTFTVMLGRYYERKREIEAHFRADKQKIYDEFLAAFFGTVEQGGESEGMVAFLRQWQRKLVLWGGRDVLAAYFKWMTRLKGGTPDVQTVFLMDEFFRALRSDIGLSSSGLPKGAFAQLILRHGAFFLQQAEKNPNLTLDEFAKLEKDAFGSDVED